MKYVLAICMIVLLLSQNSCKKSISSTTSLTGKWAYTANYVSIGGPGTWQPASEPNKWINIGNNGSFSSNLSPFNAATSWQLVDSMHIRFIVPFGQQSFVYAYTLDRINGELQLLPTGVICIEGCAQKFSK